MKTKANARFAIKNWDEKPYSEGQDRPKLTRASVTKTYTGDIEGEAQVEYLMMYRSDGSASFVGLEQVVGRIGANTGSFVLQRSGRFEGGQVPIHRVGGNLQVKGNRGRRHVHLRCADRAHARRTQTRSAKGIAACPRPPGFGTAWAVANWPGSAGLCWPAA